MDTVKFFFSLKISMDWLSRRVPCACFFLVLPMFLLYYFPFSPFSRRLNLGVFLHKTETLWTNVLENDRCCWSKWRTDLFSPHWSLERSIQGTIFPFQKWIWWKNISGATKVYFFLANERACFVSRPNGEHKNPIFFDFVVDISPPKVNNAGCSIKHHSFCNYFCLQHP